MQVIFSTTGQADFDRLPRSIQVRVLGIIERLADWPAVSGAKALRGNRAGQYRIRTGDYRIIFTVRDQVLIIEAGHRSTVYED